jgi:hypothetical protein
MAYDEELERLRRVLEQLEWEPQPGRTPGSLFVDFGEPHLPVSSAIAAITDGDRFIFYVIFGASAAPDRRDEATQFITRANYGLAIGDFGLSEELIANVILPAMSAVERYGDALIEVLGGAKDAKSAIEEVEST